MINQQSPFVKKAPSVTWIMMLVMLGLVPGTLACVFFFGIGILLNLTIAIITALIFEYFILKIRNLPIDYLCFVKYICIEVILLLYNLKNKYYF